MDGALITSAWQEKEKVAGWLADSPRSAERESVPPGGVALLPTARLASQRFDHLDQNFFTPIQPEYKTTQPKMSDQLLNVRNSASAG